MWCPKCCCNLCSRNNNKYQEEDGEALPEIEYVTPDAEHLNRYKQKFKLNSLKLNVQTGLDNYSSYEKSGFIFLQKEINIGDRPQENKGWKIHVSIEPKAIDKAWDIIMPILIENGVHLFKVANPRGYENYILEKFQSGKEIVIYGASSKVDLDWCSILGKINKELSEKGIRTDDNLPKFRESISNSFTEIVEPLIVVDNVNGYFHLSDDSKNKIEFQTWISGLSQNDRGQPFVPIDNLLELIKPKNRPRLQVMY